MNIIAKLILGCLGLIMFVIFGSYWIREWRADRKLRRSSITRTECGPVSREYPSCDWAAWQRDTRPGRVQSLRAKLRSMGE